MIIDYLLRTSEKCSTHLLAWVSSVFRGLPSLSLTMLTLSWLSAELFSQSINCTNFSQQQFPLSLQYCPHELSCRAERFSLFPYP